MPRRLRLGIVPLAVIAVLAAGGCGKKGPKLVKISGTVKYSDGTPVPGPELGKARITFSPADTAIEAGADDVKGAVAKIEAGGRFSMITLQREGAIPGKYKVLVSVWQGPDASTSLIAEKYGKKETTDLEITVDEPKSNVEFVLNKR